MEIGTLREYSPLCGGQKGIDLIGALSNITEKPSMALVLGVTRNSF